MEKNSQVSKSQPNLYAATALYDAISAGFLMLAARGMKNTPARDELGQRILLLVEDLKAEKLTDPDALSKVLDTIGRTFQDWPSTALIIQMLRPKDEGRTYLGLPPIEYKKETEESDRNARKILKQLKTRLHQQRQADRAEQEKRIEQRKAEIAKMRHERGFPSTEETLKGPNAVKITRVMP